MWGAGQGELGGWDLVQPNKGWFFPRFFQPVAAPMNVIDGNRLQGGHLFNFPTWQDVYDFITLHVGPEYT